MRSLSRAWTIIYSGHCLERALGGGKREMNWNIVCRVTCYLSRVRGREMNVNYPCVSSVTSQSNGGEQNISADDKRSEIKGQGATCCKFDGNFLLWHQPRLWDWSWDDERRPRRRLERTFLWQSYILLETYLGFMILLPGYRPDCSNHKVSQIFWTCLDTLPIAINHNTENQDQPASGHPGQARQRLETRRPPCGL